MENYLESSVHLRKLADCVYLLGSDTPPHRINLICRDRKMAIPPAGERRIGDTTLAEAIKAHHKNQGEAYQGDEKRRQQSGRFREVVRRNLEGVISTDRIP